jgi:ribonuclease P protein component
MTPATITTLKRRADFLAAASSGFKFVKPALIVQARRRKEGELSPSPIRIGLTATRKLGNAVTRNRVKRRLRSAAAQIIPQLGLAGCDYVFIGREDACRGTFADLIRDMKHALKRLSEMMR